MIKAAGYSDSAGFAIMFEQEDGIDFGPMKEDPF
jgi:hypothetical protein